MVLGPSGAWSAVRRASPDGAERRTDPAPSVDALLDLDLRASSGRGLAPPDLGRRRCPLLDLDLCSLLLQGSLDLLGLVARDAFLDGLGRSVDQILGLLETELGQLADHLDDRDLVRPDLGQDRAELGLLFGSRSTSAGTVTGGSSGRRGSCSDGSSGGDAVAVF